MTDRPCNGALLARISLILLCLLPGCVQMKKADPAASSKLPGDYMAAGDYQKALELHHAAFLKDQENLTVKEEYLKALEDIGSAAAAAYEKGEYAKAGRVYRTLLLSQPGFSAMLKKPNYERKFLQSRISACSSALSKQGLEHYRGGNLKLAIAVWEGVISFDPENAEIRKMIATANTQLKNLGDRR